MADALHALARQGRAHSAVLLADADDPHAELLTLFWGPRFDREHALSLWARFSRRQPADAVPVLPELLAVGDSFDAMDRREQQRLRRLILRHRQLSPAQRPIRRRAAPSRISPLGGQRPAQRWSVGAMPALSE